MPIDLSTDHNWFTTLSYGQHPPNIIACILDEEIRLLVCNIHFSSYLFVYILFICWMHHRVDECHCCNSEFQIKLETSHLISILLQMHTRCYSSVS